MAHSDMKSLSSRISNFSMWDEFDESNQGIKWAAIMQLESADRFAVKWQTSFFNNFLFFCVVQRSLHKQQMRTDIVISGTTNQDYSSRFCYFIEHKRFSFI